VKLRYTARARLHLDTIAEFLAERNPSAAARVGRRIQEVVQLLCEFPYMGHEGALPGTREMTVPGVPYIIVYRLAPADETLTILGIYHSAQRRPGT
jgi:toxin ParE1/3/4